jgi:hypothetical protein
MQTQTKINPTFKQGNQSKGFTGIEFSGFNWDQSISPTQLLVFIQYSNKKWSKKWNSNQELKKKDVN